MLVATNRRYTIRHSAPDKKISCAECGEPMLTTEECAKICGITQRRIFQIIETDAAHFMETETGATMICITSLAGVLNGEQIRNSTENSR